MNLATSAIDFKDFYWIEFFTKFDSKLQKEIGESEAYQTISELNSWLCRNKEYMESVEELAGVEHSSEITMFLADLLEKIDMLEVPDLMEILESQTSDFCELFTLLSEEDYFMASISSFIVSTKNKEVSEELNEEPLVSEDQSESLQNTEEIHEKVVENEALDEIKLSYSDALIEIILERLQEKTAAKHLVNEIFASQESRNEYKNLLLPGEVQNIITLVNEVILNSNVNIYSNINLIISNIDEISEDFWQSYDKSGFSVKKAYANDGKATIQPFEEVKKIAKKPVTKIDPEIKSKLKTYFLNDVKENLDELKKQIQSVPDYELFDSKQNEIFSIVVAIRDMASIHGYEALEIVMVEFYNLIKDAIKDHVVVTEDTKNVTDDVYDATINLLSHLEEDSEKDYVDTVFESFNDFNETLALVEYADEEEKSEELAETKDADASEEVLFDDTFVVSELWSVNKKLVLADKFDALRSNLTLYHFDNHLKLLDKYIADQNFCDKHLLYEQDEVVITNALSRATEKKETKTSEDDLVNLQKYAFEDIVERTGVYEPIFLLKLKKLKKLLVESEIEKLVQLVNGLAVETNWLALDNLSDFFNFINLNVDEIISNRKQSLINEEIELIRKDYIHYEFNVERFSEEEHDEALEKIEASDKEDLWIDHVANVIENESVDLDIEIGSLKFDDVNAIDPDIRDIFNEEAQEYLTKLSMQLERLRENASDTEAVLVAEKSASTLKGAAKMLNLNSIGEIASKIERAFETTKFANKEILEENLDKIEKLLKIISDILTGELATEEALEQSQTVSEIINPETDDEMLDIFQEESKSNIEGIEDAINILYSDIENLNAVKRIEADALSLKSAAKMLGFRNIGMLSESIEQCAEQILSDKQKMTKHILDSLNNVTSVIKKIRLGQEVSLNAVKQVSNALGKSIHKNEENEKKSEELSAIIEDDIDEFKELFLEESSQFIHDFKGQIDALHQNDDPDLKSKLLNNIFTVKGSASMVQLNSIKQFVTYFEELIEDFDLKDQKIYDLSIEFIAELKQAAERLKRNDDKSSDTMRKLMHELNAISPDHGSDTAEEFIENDEEYIQNELLFDESDLDDSENLNSDNSNAEDVVAEAEEIIEESSPEELTEERVEENTEVEAVIDEDIVAETVEIEEDIEVEEEVTPEVKEIVSIEEEKEEIKDLSETIERSETRTIDSEENKQIKSIAFSLINKRIELHKKSNQLKKVINSQADNKELKEIFESFENSSDELNELIKNLTKTISKNLMIEDKNNFRIIDCKKLESNLESYYIDSQYVEKTIDFQRNDYNEVESLYRYNDNYVHAIDFDSKVIGADHAEDKLSVIIINLSSNIFALITSLKPKNVQFSFNEHEENIDDLFSYLAIDDNGKLGLLVNLTKLKIKAPPAEAEEMTAPTNGEMVQNNESGIQALIVDDSISIRKFVGKIIESMGYKSILANDGADAVSKMNGKKIDLIITDIEMPNIDGLEFIKTVRNMEEHKAVPILVLVGRSAADKVDDAISLGASSSIVKPFKELEFKGKLSEIILE